MSENENDPDERPYHPDAMILVRAGDWVALEQERDEARFKQWYFEARLDAWANKCMALEMILKQVLPNDLRRGSTELQMGYAEEKFQKAQQAIMDRLNEWMAERQQ